MKKVLFLTSVFNRKDNILKSIQSLQKIIPDKTEALFVIYDSNSSDGTFKALSCIENVKLIKGSEKVFWAEGMKILLQKVFEQCELEDTVFVFFNDDITVFENEGKKWFSDALKNNLNGIATGAFFKNNSGMISYGGFKKGILKFSKITDVENVGKIDALNFNLAMFLPAIVENKVDDWFGFRHGFADIYSSFLYKKSGGELAIPEYIVGLCENNNYIDKYNLKNFSNITISQAKKDPKFLPREDYRKFTKLFGYLRPLILFKTFVGLYAKWLMSRLLKWLR